MKAQIIQWLKIKRLEICCIFVLLVVLGGSWVGNTAKINNLLTTITKQKQEFIDMKAKIQLLESELIGLKSADRIIPIATDKLGLETPKIPPVIILDSLIIK